MARGEPLMRQWNLLKTLQANRFGIAANELADRLACSKRQVQRDLNVLQQVGFPIGFEERDFGARFWNLSPHFLERQELMLSVTEMISLFLSRQLLVPLAGTQLGDGLATALDKIKALLPAASLGHFVNLNESLLVKNVAQHDYSGQDKEIGIISRAIADRVVLRVRYASPRRERAFEGRFHPYGFVLFGANLYCIGYVPDRNDTRTLKVSRFTGVETTNERFERPDDFSLETYLHGCFGIFRTGEPQTIRVRFTDWAAVNVREQLWHASQKTIEDDGERVVAEFRLADTIEFKRWLLGFGRHAVVLSPRKLAADITAELAAASEAYRA